MNDDIKAPAKGYFTGGDADCAHKKIMPGEPLNLILLIMVIVMAVMYAMQYIQNMHIQSMNEIFRNMLSVNSNTTHPIMATGAIPIANQPVIAPTQA